VKEKEEEKPVTRGLKNLGSKEIANRRVEVGGSIPHRTSAKRSGHVWTEVRK